MPGHRLQRLFFCLNMLLLVAQPVLASGVDSDGDGVADAADRCPNTPKLPKVGRNFKYALLFEPENLQDEPPSVPVDLYGCPLDSDGDSVADHLDYCPHNSALEISAGVHANGCPLQSDGDGTPDYRDRCPGTPRGVRTGADGCPD